MAKTNSGALISPALERDLRHLHFTDRELEETYRRDYAENARLHLRLVLGITLVIPLAGFVAKLAGGTAQGGASDIWVLAIHLSALLLTWSRWFARLFQGALAILCLVATLSAVAGLLPGKEAVHPLIVGAISTYTLFRLRYRLAVGVYWALTAAFVALSVWRYNVPPAALLPAVIPTVIANLMGMAAAYTLEGWSRRVFLLARLLEREQEKSEQLLLNVLPETIAQRLKERPSAVADSFPDVTVLFADIVDFTPLASALTAEATVALLNEVFSSFDALADKHGLEKIKTIGDAYMVVGGLPEPRRDHVEAVMAMALEMQRVVSQFRRETGEPLALRIGIHTGPVVAGVIGTRKFIYDLWGDTVNLASRMETYGVPGGIQVTQAAYDRLQGQYGFLPRRLEDVKGMGELTAYVLSNRTHVSEIQPTA